MGRQLRPRNRLTAMGNSAVGGQALCSSPTCHMFSQHFAKKAMTEQECKGVTIKFDPANLENVIWSPIMETAPFEATSSLAQDPQAVAHPTLLQQRPKQSLIKVPRSVTSTHEGVDAKRADCMQRAVNEAAAEAEAAEASRRAREDRLRQELEERRSKEESRRAEVEAERRRREEDARQRREVREETARATRERHEREEEEARQRVESFLALNGFASVRQGRRRRLRTAYPLHVAVKQNDPDMVSLLLQANADPAQRDTIGRTPKDVAQRHNRHGSHEKVLAMLAAR